MGRHRAERRRRAAIRNGAQPSRSSKSRVRLGLVAVAGLCIAAVIVLVAVRPGDETRYAPAPTPSSPERRADDPERASSAFVIPVTPAPVTVDGLKQEALEVAGDLLDRFPEAPEAHHLMALLQKALRQTDDARQCWRACLDLAPDHTGARVGLARVHVDQGDDAAAVETLEKALDLGCSSPEVYRVLATALMHLGRFERAVDVLQRGLADFPQSYKCRTLLGQVRLQRNQFALAEKDLREAIALASHYTDAHYALATVCARQGKHGEAASHRKRFGELKAKDRELEDRLALTPDVEMMRQRTAATLTGAAHLCLESGDRADAERFLLRAAAIDPEMPESYRLLATLYHGAGRIPDALTALRHLMEIEPENGVNYINAAGLYALEGDTPAAEEVLERAIDLRPDRAAGYCYLAQLYLKTGRLEQARSLAEEAMQREATAAGYQLLASACRQLGDTAAAEAAAAQSRRLAAADGRSRDDTGTRPSEGTGPQ